MASELMKIYSIPNVEIKRRVWDVYYTHCDTKLYVKDGRMIEERLTPLPSFDTSPDQSSLEYMSMENYVPPVPTPDVDTEAKRLKSNTKQAEAALEFYNIKHFPVDYVPPLPTPDVDTEAKRLKSNTKQAEAALEFYNIKHRKNYVLADPVDYLACMWNGEIWYHCNFTAKPGTSSQTSSTLFFAELKNDSRESGMTYMVSACFPVHDIETVKHCEMCGEGSVVHPTFGFLQGLND